MGRVDEAMRRAAAGTGVSVPVPDSDVAALSAEPFPAEEPEALAASPAFNGLGDSRSAASGGVLDSAATAPAHSFVFDGFSDQLSKKVVTDTEMLPASREQYRKLAAGLHAAQRANGVKVIMIASAVAGEGKTLTATNLALTLSESYQRSVLLIDGDLRRPAVHTVFKIDGGPGLTDCLSAPDERRLPLHRITEKLTILGAGRATSDPMAGLTSDRMHKLVEEAREVFDWVIIDTPPVGLLTDANLLSTMVDAALLVVKANHTPYYLVQKAVDAIGRDRVLGVVLNRATLSTEAYGYDYYHAYHEARVTDGRGE